MILGLDLNNKNSQLSYIDSFENGIPVTLAEEEQEETCIPTVLAKLKGVNGWVFGNEALELSEKGEAFAATGLLESAICEEAIVLEDTEFEAVELLLLFVKKMLGLGESIGGYEKAERICICLENFEEETSNVIDYIRKGLSNENIDFISRNESFYQYIIHQREELWHQDVVILEYTNEIIKERSFRYDRKTKPQICTVDYTERLVGSESLDEQLLSYCEKSMEGRIVTTVYMLGDAPDELRKTISFLCMKRRVFKGKNLYSKGACYAAAEACQQGISKKYIYLGRDKLKNNISLQLLRGREEEVETLVEAGVNWYDVNADYEFYLGNEKEIRLLLTPIMGHNEYYAVIRLSEFPERESHTTRFRINLSMKSPDRLLVRVFDLGFGDFFKSSGIVVEEEIKVREDI